MASEWEKNGGTNSQLSQRTQSSTRRGGKDDTLHEEDLDSEGPKTKGMKNIDNKKTGGGNRTSGKTRFF